MANRIPRTTIQSPTMPSLAKERRRISPNLPNLLVPQTTARPSEEGYETLTSNRSIKGDPSALSPSSSTSDTATGSGTGIVMTEKQLHYHKRTCGGQRSSD